MGEAREFDDCDEDGFLFFNKTKLNGVKIEYILFLSYHKLIKPFLTLENLLPWCLIKF